MLGHLYVDLELPGTNMQPVYKVKSLNIFPNRISQSGEASEVLEGKCAGDLILDVSNMEQGWSCVSFESKPAVG